jgi:hypothetical protein
MNCKDSDILTVVRHASLLFLFVYEKCMALKRSCNFETSSWIDLIQEEIKRRLNSGNACYHSVQNLLNSRLLSKNIKIRIYKTITLPVVLYGCETWTEGV